MANLPASPTTEKAALATRPVTARCTARLRLPFSPHPPSHSTTRPSTSRASYQASAAPATSRTRRYLTVRPPWLVSCPAPSCCLPPAHHSLPSSHMHTFCTASRCLCSVLAAAASTRVDSLSLARHHHLISTVLSARLCTRRGHVSTARLLASVVATGVRTFPRACG